ncbi:uncharacterized protein LOC141679380 [Apium graveolens]|uniref:uncharacterized protein LOC141679380 n=1 Tax=Apium graveolens TaxID=4045 RepID=UPI003D7A78DB
MIEDILLRRRRLVKNDKLILNEKQLEFYALSEIHELFRSIGKSLKFFDQLPQPPDSYLNFGNNNLVLEEANCDVLQMKAEYEKLLQSCNQEQMQVHNPVLQSSNSGDGGLFFVYGSGGCGKTYLWRTLIAKLRSEGEIVLPVAISGIAATLMPGGRTAHSRFKIPIILDEFSVCGIGHDSDINQLIKQTKLIIWGEAPMQHRHAFECLDRSLKDIMKAVHPSRLELPFGGITVVLGGDFRQILPVIPLGERDDVVSAVITRSRLWDICNFFQLKQNIRLHKGNSNIELEQLKLFGKWVLDIGEGKVAAPEGLHNDDAITIPDMFL